MMKTASDEITFNHPGNRVKVYGHTPRIELRQLRYFLAVAEELNFTRAAERMGVAQPPLSQQILALEHQLRVQLFVRSNRNVAITPEGKELEIHARRLINLTQVAGEAVQAISRGEDGPLALGAIFSSIYAIIPQILPLFIRSYPKVKLHLQEMTISQQISALKEHQIDAGILRGPVFDADLETEILFQEDFVAVVAKNNELSSRTILSLHEVSQQPLIRVFASANRDYSRRMFSALLDRGYVLNIVQEVSDTHTLIGLVAAGVGVSLVPASLQNIQISQVRYIPLNEETPKTTLELVWHRRNKSPVLLNFIDLVKSIIKEIHPNCLTGLQPYQP